jgi:N-acetylmuramoyl-L-alanine amidase CwlA
VGKPFSTEAFDQYVHSLSWTTWKPSFLVLHNTADPSLADVPNGFTSHNMDGFVSYYRDNQHWSAGPHLFCDDHQIWVFTPLTRPGVHSPSWNRVALGCEMLGDFATEDFASGRGLAVRQNAESAIAILCHALGWPASNFRLHKEDPKTTHVCPGKNVVKDEVIAGIAALLGPEASNA